MNIKRPETYLFAGNVQAPNNPRLPVVIYREAIKNGARKAEKFEERFKANGWGGVWQDTIYTYLHFHTNAHEAIAIAEGRVTLEVGGESGMDVELNPGDVIVLPAGTGHRRLSKDKVLAVGAYPKGQEKYNMCRDHDECADARREIAKVAPPEKDPVYGDEGPLLHVWPGKKSHS